MELLNLNKKNQEVEISAEATQIQAFATLITRDLSSDKAIVKKEFAFLYFYVNPLSPFFYIRDLEQRKNEIAKTIGFEDTWDLDPYLSEAIRVYGELCMTLQGILHNGACSAAMACNDYFKDARKKLDEVDSKGQPILDISKLTAALARVPKIMLDLSASYKALVIEQANQNNKQRGSKQLNMFANGFRSDNEQVSDSTD